MDQEQGTRDMSSEGSTPETTQVSTNMVINHRQFHETVPTYVTFPDVSFDGFNFHLVFLSSTPVPMDDPSASSTVRVAARLVMPWPTADATARALLDALNAQKPVGLLADMVRQAQAAAEGEDSDE